MTLAYDGDERWTLRRPDGRILQNYTDDDVRASVVYRARCFADEADAEAYTKAPPLELDDVLATLADELVRRGAVASVEAALRMPRRAFALKLLDTLAAYPLPPAPLIPYNYCALPRLLRGRLAPLGNMAARLLAPACAARGVDVSLR